MAKREWNPGELLELSGYFWRTCTLHAAVKLDVFTIIGDKNCSCEEVAQRLDADPRGVGMLLNALVAMELLTKVDKKFATTPSGQRFLSKNSPQYIGHIIMHHHHLTPSWNQLDQAVRSGRPVRDRASFSNEDVRESFLMGMFNMAMNMAPRLVAQIDMSGRRRLLDFGGGPGTYSIHFCLVNPQLKATVFDLTTTRPFAEKTIQQFKLADRINFIGGDYLEDEVEGRYDVAWLSHILHGEGYENCMKIIQKAVTVLEPGAMIIIHDFILNNTMDGPLFPALFSLNMLLGTPSGQAYSDKQIMDMLAAAEVREIRRLPVQTPNDSGIITGII